MLEIGDALREARTRRGLSIRDAEEATKIRTKYLQALEEDDFEVIPGPAYVMGFLRTYAEYLELDPGPLIEEYKNHYQPRFLEGHKLPAGRLSSRPGRPAPRKRPNYVLVGILAIVVILILAWIGWGNRSTGQAEIEPTISVTTSTSSAANTTTTAGGATSTTGAGGESGTTTAQAGEISGLSVKVRAVTDRCYLIVREQSATGKTLFSDTLDKGAEIEVSADEQLWMNIANPAAIIMLINGREYTVPEPYGEFVVTASGIERAREQ